MNAVPFDSNSMHSIRHGRGFSMIELLVVIAIIAVLAGLLLVALRGVRIRALALSSQTTMQEFSKACDSFQIDHGSYPGIIPEGILAANPVISGTENALLHMMGGVIRGDDPRYEEPPFDSWDEIVIDNNTDLGKIRVNLQLLGNGPEINGKPYSPYFTPKGDELRAISGQANAGGPGFGTDELLLPDLVDAWGQPIIYVRRSRKVGPLAFDTNNPDILPQFMLGTMQPYINSTLLADFGRNQQDPEKGSILFLADDPSATFAQIIRHPSFGAPDDPINGTARGAYVLISAGKDGVYFSVADGPGTSAPNGQVYNIVDDQDYGNPQVVEEYDDIRLFGGG